MGYPQTTQSLPPSGPPVQDTLSQLLGSSFDRLLEIEGHLTTIRDNPDASFHIGKKRPADPYHGRTASSIRHSECGDSYP